MYMKRDVGERRWGGTREGEGITVYWTVRTSRGKNAELVATLSAGSANSTASNIGGVSEWSNIISRRIELRKRRLGAREREREVRT